MLTAAQISQTEANIRDHIHGQDGVNPAHGSITILGSGLAVGSVAPVGLGTVNAKGGFYEDGVKLGHKGALVILQSDQVIPANTNTALIFSGSVINYDTSSIFNTLSNTLLTVPGGFSKTKVSAQVYFNEKSPAQVGRFIIFMTKNGATFPGFPSVDTDVQSAHQGTLNMTSPVLNVASGDRFSVMVHHTMTGSHKINGNAVNATWATMELIT